MSAQLLELISIRIDGDTQPRVAIDQLAVEQYASDMQRGNVFPPVSVIFDGAAYWLVDGFHRYHALLKLKRSQIQAVITTGVLADAQWQSLTANHAHGLRRTNDDKRKAVRKALQMHPELSDNALAEHVGVANVTIAKYRAALPTAPRDSALPVTPGIRNLHLPATDSAAQAQGQARRTGKDGKKYPARSPKPGLSPKAAPIFRGPSQPLEKKTHIAMPANPEAGAYTLASLFERSYLQKLLAQLTAILDGTAGPLPVYLDLPVAPGRPT